MMTAAIAVAAQVIIMTTNSFCSLNWLQYVEKDVTVCIMKV